MASTLGEYTNVPVGRLRSPHHSCGAPEMRSPEPKSHYINALLVSLLLGSVTGVPATVDVALSVALLATFASIAFVKDGLEEYV